VSRDTKLYRLIELTTLHSQACHDVPFACRDRLIQRAGAGCVTCGAVGSPCRAMESSGRWVPVRFESRPLLVRRVRVACGRRCRRCIWRAALPLAVWRRTAAPHGAELQPQAPLLPTSRRQPPATRTDTRSLRTPPHTIHHGERERQLADHQHRRAGPRQPRQLRPELAHARRRARVDRRRAGQRPADPHAAQRGRQRGSTARRAGKPALRRRRQGQGTSPPHATSPPRPRASGRHGARLGLPPTRTRRPTQGDWLTGLTTQEVYLATVIEILQSIRQSDMSPMLSRLYGAPGGTEALDVLMKYMYVVALIADISHTT
jgi:hypothetical protein